MPQSDGEFVLGSVSDPTAVFTINGTTVPVYHNGAFLAWLPVSPGSFTFNCVLGLKTGPATLARRISVTGSAVLPDKPAIDEDSLWPRSDMTLRPGEWLTFRLRGTPGAKARCRLGKHSWQELRETISGIYEGMQAAPDEQTEPSAVECRLRSAKAVSHGKLGVDAGPPLVAVMRTGAVLKTGPGNGYMAFPPAGVRLPTAGRVGSELKVQLAPTLEGWVDAKEDRKSVV
jgi:hypothetical protein